jgi:hypothetical protein
MGCIIRGRGNIMAVQQIVKERAVREREISPGIWLYSDGTKRRENGQLAELHPRARQGLTSEQAREMTVARKERRAETREKLRRAITEATNERAAIDTAGLMRELETAPEAIAYAGRLLWEQIVLNRQAPARDRRETFRDLTQEMDLLGRVADDSGEGDTVLVPVPRAVIAQLRDYILSRLGTEALDQDGDDPDIIDGVTAEDT